jgi:hypothetical protein
MVKAWLEDARGRNSDKPIGWIDLYPITAKPKRVQHFSLGLAREKRAPRVCRNHDSIHEHAPRPPAIVIALTRRHVGIALPAPQGFEFVAMDPDFELLDGSRFRRLEQLEEATQSLARAVTGRGLSEVISVRAGLPESVVRECR